MPNLCRVADLAAYMAGRRQIERILEPRSSRRTISSVRERPADLA